MNRPFVLLVVLVLVRFVLLVSEDEDEDEDDLVHGLKARQKWCSGSS